MKPIGIFFTLIIGLQISGCKGTDGNSLSDLPPELRQAAMVSVSDPSMRIPKSGSFSWMSQSLQYFNDPRIDRTKLNNMLQDAIRNTLEGKGYTYASTAGQSDFLVGYFIALEKALDDESINRFYDFKHGLSSGKGDSNEYPKGALIMDIVDAGTQQHLWRGALQAFVDFELDDDIRQKRIQMVVAQLLSGFPPK